LAACRQAGLADVWGVDAGVLAAVAVDLVAVVALFSALLDAVAANDADALASAVAGHAVRGIALFVGINAIVATTLSETGAAAAVARDLVAVVALFGAFFTAIAAEDFALADAGATIAIGGVTIVTLLTKGNDRVATNAGREADDVNAGCVVTIGVAVGHGNRELLVPWNAAIVGGARCRSAHEGATSGAPSGRRRGAVEVACAGRNADGSARKYLEREDHKRVSGWAVVERATHLHATGRLRSTALQSNADGRGLTCNDGERSRTGAIRLSINRLSGEGDVVPSASREPTDHGRDRGTEVRDWDFVGDRGDAIASHREGNLVDVHTRSDR